MKAVRGFVAVAADSSNAAEVAQAAILQSQQKKQQKHGPQSAVLTAAPVLHRPAQPTAAAVATTAEYTQYRELTSVSV